VLHRDAHEGRDLIQAMMSTLALVGALEPARPATTAVTCQDGDE
jgi:hypothetical protein